MATQHTEPTIESHVAYEGKIVNLRVDTVQISQSASVLYPWTSRIM